MTAPDLPFLPYGRQSIDEEDITAVTEVLRGAMLTQGPTVGRFEAEFAAVTGARHALAVANGTAALHLAYRALAVEPGDAVVVPAITFMATANAARMCGADVVFADVDPHTGLMTPASLEAAIHRAPTHPAVATAVHLNGQSCDMAGLAHVAARYRIKLIEDACHGLGGTSGDGAHKVGDCHLSEMATFSFHPVKTIAAGEGGAITTNSIDLARYITRNRSHGIERTPDNFQIRDQGFDAQGLPHPWYHELVELGFNYRMTDIQCALALSQLGKLPRFVARRRALVARYRNLLKPLADKVTPIPTQPGNDPGWHLFVIHVDWGAAGIARADAMRALHAHGIGSQVHYIPLYRHPFYRQHQSDLWLEGAENYYEHCLSLPLFPAMTDADVDRVVVALTGVLETHA